MTESELIVGTIVAGRYSVVRVLGQGGMGMVLEVTDSMLGGRHALKLLHAEHVADAELVTRFQNEARIAATLRSDHLVRVTDAGRLPGGEPFLVMDLLAGADLDQLLEKHTRFPVGTAVSWILQASLGLAHLHAAGFVHRDIKPSNLFCSREPDGREVIKVLDFGLAKVPSVGGNRVTATSASFGTPQFMAPEQIMSAKHVDARCDQHALALVLYELLVGEPAFHGETAGALTVAIATQPAPTPSAKNPSVPAELDRVIARALSKKPQDRFMHLGELAIALAPFGGSGALELARAIGKLLQGGGRTTDPVRPGAIAEAKTLPDLASAPDASAPTLVRPPDITSPGLASSGRLPSSQHQPRRWLLPVLVGLVSAAALGAFVSFRYLPASSAREEAREQPAQAPQATARAPEIGPHVGAAASLAPTPPPAEPTASESAEASASVSASVPSSPRPKPVPKAAPPPKAKPPADVFDAYRP